jgi:phage I-like protein
MLEELLKALGVATAAEALAAINRFTMMFDNVCQMTGAQTSGEALATMQSTHKLLQSIETCAGVKGAEVLARMEAWKSAGETLKATQTELVDLRKTQERAQAELLMETATQDKRLQPAHRPKAEEFYNSYGIKALETYLTSLPQVSIQEGGPRQPNTPKLETSPDAEWTPEDAAYAKATGRTKEQMLAARTLWTETKGEITNAHLMALNKKVTQPRA